MRVIMFKIAPWTPSACPPEWYPGDEFEDERAAALAEIAE